MVVPMKILGVEAFFTPDFAGLDRIPDHGASETTADRTRTIGREPLIQHVPHRYPFPGIEHLIFGHISPEEVCRGPEVYPAGGVLNSGSTRFPHPGRQSPPRRRPRRFEGSGRRARPPIPTSCPTSDGWASCLHDAPVFQWARPCGHRVPSLTQPTKPPRHGRTIEDLCPEVKIS